MHDQSLARAKPQEALASEAELDRTYVSIIKFGLHNRSSRNIDSISRTLGVALAVLVADL